MFSSKTEITGEMQLLSYEGEGNSFYVLRKSEEGQFFESKVELSYEKLVYKNEKIYPKKEEHKATEGGA